jgi:SAM-dependent methyltransferase
VVPAEPHQPANDDRLAATDDPFGAFERTGWSAGRAAPYHQAVGDITAQCVEALLDAAGVGPGVRVLDVATGPGYGAGRAAARGADAVGVDFSAEMVELATRLQPGVDVRLGDANALPFADGSFGAVTANFLMPHVSDLPRVVRELARVARSGGRVALTTWDAEGAVYARAIPEAVAAAGAAPPADLPPGPPFFQYAGDEEFAALLDGAGLVDPQVARIEFTHRMGDLDAFWADLIGGTVRMHALVTHQDAKTQARIRAEYERLLEPYRRDGGWEVPCVVKLGSGAKP